MRNPAAVDEIVGTYPKLTSGDVEDAIAAAELAQRGWASVTAVERAAHLQKAAGTIGATEGLVELLIREQGKVRWEAEFELSFFDALVAHFGPMAPRLDDGDLLVDDGLGRITVHHEPVGVVAAITPWNFPFALTAVKVVPALLAGNAVVIKPAPTTPLTVLAAFGAIADHFPPGLISVVTGDDDVVAQGLVDHPAVRMVSFTGSIPTGRRVGVRAAERVKRTTLELGGNDAALLLDDVEISEDLCASLVTGAFTGSGQVCFAIKRVYAPNHLVDELVDGMGAVLDQFVIGNGLDPTTSMGPVHTQRQRDFVAGLVLDAETRGGVARACGQLNADPEKGWFLRPTIVTGLDDGAPLVAEEQFGPALPILGYGAEDEALRRINASEYGLMSSVWSADEDRAAQLARRIEAGTTFVNSHSVFSLSLDLPVGGVKQSGIGRELGTEGLLSYTTTHSISTRHL